MKKKPHIVIFNPDQWRGDVMGHLGNKGAVTPHLDRFVETDAVSFSQAYCQNPVCTPSRCSFMSGWYPHVRGHRSMFNLMKPDEPVLLRYLKEAGYYVWWGGKNDLVAPSPGFEPYCDVKHRPGGKAKPMYAKHREAEWRGQPGDDSYYSFYVGKLDTEGNPYYRDSDWAHIQGAIDLIRSRPADKPLCLYLPIMYPHPPYGVEDPWYSLIDRASLPPRIPEPEDWSGKPSMTRGLRQGLGLSGWTEDRWTELRATYYGMCARVDHQFHLLMEALKEAGIYEDTAVFFFSDHGDYTGDYGLVEKAQNTFEDCLVRVPFILKPPAGTPVKPGVRDNLVELVDFVATVEDLLELELDYTHFGKSLLPLAAGETLLHREAVFSEGGRLQGEVHCMDQSAASADPAFLYYPRSAMHRSEGPEHTKATMCRTRDYKYVRRLYEQDELYDLRQDPWERVNRIGDPELGGVLAEMKERMLEHYQATCDVVPMRRDER